MKNMDVFNLSVNELAESTKPPNLDEYTTEESNSEADDDDDNDHDNDEDEGEDAFEDNDYDNDDYNSESEEFYFESDHLALRGNPDYRAILRTIVVLESQRIEVTKHIDKIVEMKRNALQDPSGFIKRLTAGQSLDISGPISIQNLPKIKLEKYNVSLPTLRPNVNTNANASANTNKTKCENDFTVRGRTFDQTKPVTFNQLWTCEEQRRLEELLVEYPPEPIEMRRFAKIAKALGNRTPRQVASRLQKYFQKLHAAGLPVPGRIPRNARSYISTRKHRMFKHMARPTTFFPSNYVPVNINDDDDNSKTNLLDPNYYRNGCNADMANELDMMVVDEPCESENDAQASDSTKIAELIRRVKRDKEREYADEISISEHNGYKCDYCDEEPIIGTRWHCVTCPDESIDFCSDCLVTQTQEQTHHSVDHTFVGYRVSTDIQSDSESDENDQSEQMQDDENITEDDSQYFHSTSDIAYDNFNILSNNINQNE